MFGMLVDNAAIVDVDVVVLVAAFADFDDFLKSVGLFTFVAGFSSAGLL